MYKILILESKQKNSFYVEDGEVFATDDIEVLKAKYLQLLDTYPKSKLDVIRDISEIVTITIS